MSGRRALASVSGSDLTEAMGLDPAMHHVIWTGYDHDRRQGSLRGQSLACVMEVATPFPLRVLLGHAARIEGKRGFEPNLVREGVWNHQGSKPAVRRLVDPAPSGDYVVVREMPHASPEMRWIGPGGLIMDWHGRMALAVAPGRAPSAP